MKKTIIILTVSLLGLTSVGCQSQSKSTSATKIITVSEEVSDSFYDNVSEWGTLTLETSERSLLGNIFKIRIHKGRIFLLNGNIDNQRLSIYDKDSGRFITHVSFQGRGPGEYVNLSNFEIDPTRDEVILWDTNGDKVLLFDLDGKFKRTVSFTSSWAACVGRLPDGRFVLVYQPGSLRSNEFHVLAICDENGALLERLIPNEIASGPTYPDTMTQDMLTVRSDGSLSLIPQFNNTVYHITDEGVTAEYGLEIPGETLTIDYLKQVFNDPMDRILFEMEKNRIEGDHAETNTYLYFQNKGYEPIFYNKISGEMLRTDHPLFGEPIFIDDEGYCWANVSTRDVDRMEDKDGELATVFQKALETGDNMPLIYYKLKI